MRLSPAVAVSAVALLVASAGSATAGSLVTTKMLKDNAVTSQKVKDGTLSLSDMSASVRAAIQKSTHPTTIVTGPTTSAPHGHVTSAIATCPAGTHPTGGGYWGGLGHAVASTPYGTDVDPRGTAWVAYIDNDTALDFDINVYAICA